MKWKFGRALENTESKLKDIAAEKIAIPGWENLGLT